MSDVPKVAASVIQLDSTSNPTPRKPYTGNGRPFVKGDPRINRKGRPKNFDQLRAEAVRIAHEVLPNSELTVIQSILRNWAKSNEPILQKLFVEIGFGKVPDKIDINALDTRTILILKHAHEMSDEDRQRIPSAITHGAN